MASQHLHTVEPGKAGQRDKTPSLQPVPRDGLSTPFSEQNSHCGPQGTASTTHKGQEVGAFLMALLTSKSDLPWVADGWGMLAPEGCLHVFFMVCCGKRVATPPHEYVMSLA